MVNIGMSKPNKLSPEYDYKLLLFNTDTATPGDYVTDSI